MFQQTPRAVTEAPPSAVTLPPEFAVVAVIDETLVVVTVGVVASVVKDSLSPYAVPSILVA